MRCTGQRTSGPIGWRSRPCEDPVGLLATTRVLIRLDPETPLLRDSVRAESFRLSSSTATDFYFAPEDGLRPLKRARLGRRPLGVNANGIDGEVDRESARPDHLDS